MARVVFVRCPHPMTGPYGLVVGSIVERLESHGAVAMLGTGPAPVRDSVCGAILIGGGAPVPYPAVGVRLRPPPDGVPAAVWVDREAAAQALVEHLRGLGHRRIARLDRAADTDQLVDAAEPPVRGHRREPDGEGLVEAAASPSALICADEILAAGALRVARERGVALAVAAFDDAGLGPLAHPEVTLVRQPWAELGATAATVLMRLLDGRNDGPLRVEVPAKIE
ncbi:substrate-binding domain-containing protein [Dactylosporangium sp. CS-047395]|uniref:substrate-binding domain-containing protein n=1 Tax=Dactylosporangium sp. CS-047395 TaxID=3239936 RepID=UPI003D8DDF99